MSIRFLASILATLTAATIYAGEARPAADANNAFAAQLYAQLNKTPGNVFFSPYSIHSALGMTHEGAGGVTLDEMRKVLHLSDAAGSPELGLLMQQMNDAAKASKAELNIANALWGQKGYPFIDSFLDRTMKSYQAQLQPWDFEKDLEGGRVAINQWVEQQTKDKIKELIKPGVLPPLTRLVLVNAIYFKGTWEKAFEAAATKPAPFTVDGGESVQVPLMHANFKELAYYKGDGFQLVRIPYKSGAFDMTILLPDEGAGALNKLSAQITPENIAKWLQASASEKPVNLFLPKFKMTGQFELRKVLESLGMTSAFDPHTANFSRMCPQNNLMIDKVIHQAFVDVNEAGTEAAAATAVIMKPRGMARPSEPPVTVRVDRSFLFMLTHTQTNAVLFMGRVIDPTK